MQITRVKTILGLWYTLEYVDRYFCYGNATGETHLHILQTLFMDFLYDVPLLLKRNMFFNKTGHFYTLRRFSANSLTDRTGLKD
jgi:hypothetical protein